MTERSDRRPPMAAIAGVLDHFTGPIEQVPPAYSALKIDGKRAYDRARAGETVEMKTRAVTVHDLYLAGGREDAEVRSAFATTAGRPDPYDPQAPPFPRAPTSVRWHGTSHGRLARWVTSPIYGASRPDRSSRNRRFRWTSWRKSLRARPLKTFSCRLRQDWTTSRSSPSTPTARRRSARAGYCRNCPIPTGSTSPPHTMCR